jgi:hypothetical protein
VHMRSTSTGLACCIARVPPRMIRVLGSNARVLTKIPAPVYTQLLLVGADVVYSNQEDLPTHPEMPIPARRVSRSSRNTTVKELTSQLRPL